MIAPLFFTNLTSLCCIFFTTSNENITTLGDHYPSLNLKDKLSSMRAYFSNTIHKNNYRPKIIN